MSPSAIVSVRWLQVPASGGQPVAPGQGSDCAGHSAGSPGCQPRRLASFGLESSARRLVFCDSQMQ